MRRALLPCLICVALTGCASAEGNYPSLLPRPIEKADLNPPTPPTPAAPASDPALDARITDLSKQMQQAGDAFDAEANGAENIVQTADAATVGSANWIEAQSALAKLDSLRGDALIPLSALEQLAIDRAQQGLPPYPALETALTKAEATDTAIEKRLNTLEQLAGGPPAAPGN